MTQRYENIMVAVDGSKEADLAFVKSVQETLVLQILKLSSKWEILKHFWLKQFLNKNMLI